MPALSVTQHRRSALIHIKVWLARSRRWLRELRGSPMQPKPLILLVEDEADLRALWAEFLEREGYRIASAVDWPQGAAMLRASPPQLLITNVRLPGGSGRDLEKLARAMDVP